MLILEETVIPCPGADCCRAKTCGGGRFQWTCDVWEPFATRSHVPYMSDFELCAFYLGSSEEDLSRTISKSLFSLSWTLLSSSAQSLSQSLSPYFIQVLAECAILKKDKDSAACLQEDQGHGENSFPGAQ